MTDKDTKPMPSTSLAEMIRAHQEQRDAVYPTPGLASESPEVEHIVDYWESVITSLLRWAPRRFRRPPRALCGFVCGGGLEHMNLPPYPQTPYCPACLEVDGRDLNTIAATVKHIPGRRI